MDRNEQGEVRGRVSGLVVRVWLLEPLSLRYAARGEKQNQPGVFDSVQSRFFTLNREQLLHSGALNRCQLTMTSASGPSLCGFYTLVTACCVNMANLIEESALAMMVMNICFTFLLRQKIYKFF